MATTEQNVTLGILVCTHSSLADSLKQAIEMLMGPQENFETLGLYEGGDVFSLCEEIKKQVGNMHTKKNLVFTDLFGASPSNAAAMSLVDINAVIITGVNLPMLAEVLTLRGQQQDLNDLVIDIVNKGKDSIRTITKEMLSKG
jgi:PTS system mannose-specific IIA component